MAVLFSDDFSVAAIQNWFTAFGNWEVTGGVLTCVGHGAEAGRRRTTANAHAPIADVRVSVKRASISGWNGAVIARSDEAMSTFYFLNVYGGNTWAIVRLTPGTADLLGSFTQSYGDDAVISLEVTGTNPVVLRAFHNGVQVGSDITDSSANRIVTAGQTGIMAFVGSNPVSFDDFLVESASAPPAGGGVVLGEAASAAESLTAALAHSVSLTESVAASDALSAVAQLVAALSESAVAADALSAALTALAQLAESASSADQLSAIASLQAALTEVGSAVEALSSIATLPVSVIETGSAAEVLSGTGSDKLPVGRWVVRIPGTTRTVIVPARNRMVH